MYADGASEHNGKCYYWGPGGSSSLAYSGNRWELLVNGNQLQASTYSINSSNPKLPPTGGWPDGMYISCGPSVSFQQTAVTVNEEDGGVSLRVNMTSFPYGIFHLLFHQRRHGRCR